MAQALTKTKNGKQIATIVDAFEDADTIKPQDLRAWFAGVLANPAGQQAAWDWFRTSWDWLNDTVGGDMEFPTYITVISRVFHTQPRLGEFTEFFTPKRGDASLTREIDMDTAVIAGRVALINAEAASVNAAVAEAIK